MRSRHIQDTRQFYLWSIGTIYMIAFVSLYVQIPGLYGPTGLLPVYNVIPKQKVENHTINEHLQSLYSFPSVLLYSNYLGLSPEYVMELCCIVGALLSFLVMTFQIMRCSFIFLVIWALYLSLHKVGQTFLYFQWDSLLLETGILTVLVAPLNLMFWKKPSSQAHDSSSFWLVRWLLFRLMFASGVVKLTSQCPTWWGLTALNWHYESQCIPTPLAWYAHQLPQWFQSLSVVGTYYIEILVPFLFFLPFRSLRLYAFWNQIFFQVCIIATGNYNFFNLLTIALCISLLDDSDLDSIPFWKKKRVPKDWTQKAFHYIFGRKCGPLFHSLLRLVVFLSVVCVSLGVVVYLFDVSVDLKNYEVFSKIAFSEEEFNMALHYLVMTAAVMGGASLLFELLYAIWDSLSKQGAFARMWSFIQTCIMGSTIIVMFSISLVPLGYLDKSFQQQLPQEIYTVHDTVQPLQFVSPYGLFRRMTGVGGRPELVIEGANNENGPWLEYEFLYKPGHPDKPLPLVAPHQPRLDWQMWFAALGSYEYNPWLVNLVFRLLLGQKEVLELMAPPPFEKPPHLIRVRLFQYHYTKYDTSQSVWNQTGPWWKRKFQKDYLFSLSLDHTGLRDYLKQMKLDEIPTSHCNIPYVCTAINQLRPYSRLLPPTELLMAIVTTATILQLTLVLLSNLFGNKTVRIKKVHSQVKLPQEPVTTTKTQKEGGTNHKKNPPGKRNKNSKN